MENFLKTFKKYEAWIFLALTLAIGVILILPYHNFQLHLAQGDHGRDLYAFKKTMDGAIPYRDYWWIYGPLMPHYYSAFFHIFGVSIHSVIIGYQLLNFLSGAVVYLCLALFVGPLLALTGAVWYWVFVPPFEHTYVFAGGILAILLSAYSLLAYIRRGKDVYLSGSLLAIFILLLIKLNIGISCLGAFLISVFLVDRVNKISFSRRKLFFYISAATIVVLALAIYYSMIRGLPLYVIRQCFPYFASQQPSHLRFVEILDSIWKYSLFKNAHWTHPFICFLFLSSLGYFAAMFLRRKLTYHQPVFLALISLGLFTIFNMHEILMSGVSYRIYWIKPTEILFLLLVIFTVLEKIPKLLRWCVCAVILVSAFQAHTTRYHFIKFFKVPTQYLGLERGKVYIGNDQPWIRTVADVIGFLFKNVRGDKTFLALVDDPLYYFLTDKDSPTRQLAFGNHLDIRPEQEQEIIQTLEQQQIEYILLSNRAFSSEDQYMGKFGITYCQLLGEYIRKNFVVFREFGDWNKEATWFSNHAVMILKRIQK